jgi:hypothetical protein
MKEAVMNRFVVAVLIGALAFAGAAAGATIATVELDVRDGAGGSVLSSSGPSTWIGFAEVTAIPVGMDRVLDVLCRDAAGRPIYTGQMTGIDVFAQDPFSLTGFLAVVDDGSGGMDVLLNGILSLGPIELIPVQDVTPVAVDIRPGSSANPVNVKANGVLTVVLLGAADLDVTAIDRPSLTLEGVAPIRIHVADVESVVDRSQRADGHSDLVLQFRTEDIVAALGAVRDGEVLGLVMRGILADGTAIEGVDHISVLAKPAR